MIFDLQILQDLQRAEKRVEALLGPAEEVLRTLRMESPKKTTHRRDVKRHEET